MTLLLLALAINEVHGALSWRPAPRRRCKRCAPDQRSRSADRGSVRARLPTTKSGHLLNALNLPVAKLAERAGELGKDKSKPVLLYCALGGVAGEAAAKLRKLGYSEVYPLRGGINGWLGSNLPVTVK